MVNRKRVDVPALVRETDYTFVMGLTIHYQGQLRSELAYESFLDAVGEIAVRNGWPLHRVDEAHREMIRTLQPEDPNASEFEEVYAGPVRGVYVLPDPRCEPLSFEFDQDLFMQDWCKTQFAGWQVHAAVVGVFRQTEGLFEMLDVQDESGFSEAADGPESRAALIELFAETMKAIKESAEESPGCSIGVVTPSGRILDILAA